MKKLSTVKKINDDIQEMSNMMAKISILLDNANKEYAKNINKLLKKIAEGENLDYEMLKEKYVKSSPIIIKTEEPVVNDDTIIYSNDSDEIIFDKITINNKDYYYENKENSKIYDSLSNIVGVYKNKQFSLT